VIKGLGGRETERGLLNLYLATFVLTEFADASFIAVNIVTTMILARDTEFSRQLDAKIAPSEGFGRGFFAPRLRSEFSLKRHSARTSSEAYLP
jgi:hypothetical protein